MIEQVRRAAWQGWEKSLQDQERERVKTAAAPNDAGADESQTRTDQDTSVEVERTKERRTQCGDSRLLQIALNCSETILRTLGAFKTKPTPPVNTWDTVLKTLYQQPATANAEDDPAPIERVVNEVPAGAEAKAEELDIPPKPSDADLEPGEYRELVEVEVDDGEEEPGATGQGQEEPGAREENAETATSAAPVSDAEPGAQGCCSSRQAGDLPHGGETPTSAAPASEAEPEAQVSPGKEQTPKALGADDPDDCWPRRWSRLASEWSGGLTDARLLPRGPP
jgi:hypothetical protein